MKLESIWFEILEEELSDNLANNSLQLLIASCSSVNAMVHAMAETKSGPLSPKKPVKEKIVGIYDDFFKVSLSGFI